MPRPSRAAQPSPRRSADATSDPLLSLLQERTGGAVNIRGIRLQLLYATTRALGLLRPETRDLGVHFEGLEDADVDGLALQPWRLLDAGEEPSIGTADDAGGVTPAATTTLVQVKSSLRPWTWSQLREVMAGFLTAYRAARAADASQAPASTLPRFQLVLCATPRAEVAALAAYAARGASEQRRLRVRFRALVERDGATVEEADSLLSRLTITITDPVQLQTALRAEIAAVCPVGGVNGLDAMETALVGHALAWAQARTRVSAADVRAVVQRLVEGFAQTHRFAAYVQHWVAQPSRLPDSSPDDFLDARGTRPGHIVLGLDVPRPRWTARIAEALRRVPICVLRAPSGQGKSTMAQRFAVDHWEATSVVEVLRVEAAGHVAAIQEFLEFRQGIGAPVRVLLDVRVETRRWSELAAICASRGIPMLVTVRSEDWHRYTWHSVTRFELVEPFMDTDEATSIFAQLRASDRVHPDVPSAAHALEQVGSPALLLEFVYLVTHGRMLEERLRDQLMEMQRAGQDPAQRAVLRRAVTADVLGVPLPLDALLAGVPLRDDVQLVVQPLMDEYVIMADGRVRGVHWVRSQHLVRLLHQNGVPPLTSTVTALIGAIPTEVLAGFVATACSYPEVERGRLVEAAVAVMSPDDAARRVAIVNGLFEAGEQDCFREHRSLFDESERHLGASGPILVGWEMMPALRAGLLSGFLSLMAAREQTDASRRLHDLRDRANAAVTTPRGVDLVRAHLPRLLAHANVDAFWTNDAVQRLLYWAAAAEIPVPGWATVCDAVVATPIHALPFATLTTGAAVLARVDGAAYLRWYRRHHQILIARARIELHALELHVGDAPVHDPAAFNLAEQALEAHVTERPFHRVPPRDAPAWLLGVENHDELGAGHVVPVLRVILRYPVQAADTSGKTPHTQTLTRIEILRRLFAFAERFDIDGDWILPEGLPLLVDDTVKRMPRANTPDPWDVRLNVVWGALIAGAMLPASSVVLVQRWHAARTAMKEVARAALALGDAHLRGRAAGLAGRWSTLAQTLEAAQTALRALPHMDEAVADVTGPRLSEGVRFLVRDAALHAWATAMGRIVKQLGPAVAVAVMPAAAANAGVEAIRPALLAWNMREALESIAPLHAAFETLFRDVPDDADLRALNASEAELFSELVVLIDGWLVEPIARPDARPMETIRLRNEQTKRTTLARLSALITKGAATMGRNVILPTAVLRHEGFLESAVGLDVPTLDDAPMLVLALCLTLRADPTLVNYLWVLPLVNGARVGDGGYQFSTFQLDDGGVLARFVDDEEVSPDDLQRALGTFGMLRRVPDRIATLLGPLPHADPPAPSLLAVLRELRAIILPLGRRALAIFDAVAQQPTDFQRPLRDALWRDIAEERARVIAQIRSLRETIALAPLPMVQSRDGAVLADLARQADAFLAGCEHLCTELDGAREALAQAMHDWSSAYPPDSLDTLAPLQEHVRVTGVVPIL